MRKNDHAATWKYSSDYKKNLSEFTSPLLKQHVNYITNRLQTSLNPNRTGGQFDPPVVNVAIKGFWLCSWLWNFATLCFYPFYNFPENFMKISVILQIISHSSKARVISWYKAQFYAGKGKCYSLWDKIS